MTRNLSLLLLPLLASLVLGPLHTGCASSREATPSGHDHDHDHPDQENDEPAGNDAPEIVHICPMHPQIRQPDFGTCPICFMDLVPVPAGGEDPEPTVRPSEASAARANIVTGTARRVPLQRELRLFGRLAAAETAETEVTAWTRSRVERLHVQARGERVRRGQPVAELYSPALFVAQQNLRQGRQLQTEHEPGSALHRAGEELERAAREELRLLGARPQQIRAMAESDRPVERLTLVAEHDGVVEERRVREGDWVEAGAPLIRLTALDTLWAQVEFREAESHHARVGLPVRLTLPDGTALHEGTITFVDPVVDTARRLVRARVVVPNPDGRLRPGQWIRASATLRHPAEHPPVSVPASAVLWTGERSIVYVLDAFLNPPGFIAAEVELGERWGDRWIVKDGVFDTETIAVNGAFRLDASLQILGGPTMMGRVDPATGEAIEEGDHAH